MPPQPGILGLGPFVPEFCACFARFGAGSIVAHYGVGVGGKALWAQSWGWFRLGFFRVSWFYVLGKTFVGEVFG